MFERNEPKYKTTEKRKEMKTKNKNKTTTENLNRENKTLRSLGFSKPPAQ